MEWDEKVRKEKTFLASSHILGKCRLASALTLLAIVRWPRAPIIHFAIYLRPSPATAMIAAPFSCHRPLAACAYYSFRHWYIFQAITRHCHDRRLIFVPRHPTMRTILIYRRQANVSPLFIRSFSALTSSLPPSSVSPTLITSSGPSRALPS
jgi:hypothetical protein